VRLAGCSLFQCVREIRAALVFLKISGNGRTPVRLGGARCREAMAINQSRMTFPHSARGRCWRKAAVPWYAAVTYGLTWKNQKQVQQVFPRRATAVVMTCFRAATIDFIDRLGPVNGRFASQLQLTA
jgi:hypothetical protein